MHGVKPEVVFSLKQEVIANKEGKHDEEFR
jgi:hypothetical protein